MSTELRLLAVEASLKKMLAGGYFDICTVDQIVQLMELKPDYEAYGILRTLHCVHYNQMPPKLLEALPDLIHRVLNSPSFEASRINVVQHGNVLALVRN